MQAALGDAVGQRAVPRRVDAVEARCRPRRSCRRPPRLSSAPSWAAPSMPSASPETTVSPAAAQVRGEGARVLARPARVGLRLPTMAIAGALQQLEPAVRVQQQRRVGGLAAAPADSAGRRASARRRAGRPAGRQPAPGGVEQRCAVPRRRRSPARRRAARRRPAPQRAAVGVEHRLGRAEGARAAGAPRRGRRRASASSRSQAASSSRSSIAAAAAVRARRLRAG